MAQVNPTVGDLDGNSRIVADYARRALEAGARLAVFPELAVTGYPVEDLALRNSFVSASVKAVAALAERLAAEGLGELPVAVGYLSRRSGVGERYGQPAGAPQNAFALLYRGRVAITSAKHHLPNYGVFDEFRHFVPGEALPVVRLHGVDVAFAVCEDLWQGGGPVAAARRARAGLLVTVNASPYEREKGSVRLELCQRRAREIGAAVGYANMSGGQDELVFDGDSLIVDAEGELLARAPRFEEDLFVTDLALPAARGAEGHAARSEEPGEAVDGVRVVRHVLSAEPVAAYTPEPPVLTPRADPASDVGEVYRALVVGVRDYARKNGFGSAAVALSGGIDSAVAITVAADALGADRVHALLLPSKYSSEHSVSDAEDLVERQGIRARTVEIAPIVAAFEEGIALDGVAAENLQARVRGTLLMGLSNQEGHLVLATGNKSELAVGYSTIYGDTVGGYAPLVDVPKTHVAEIARWRNAAAVEGGDRPPIPSSSIETAPSAELRRA